MYMSGDSLCKSLHVLNTVDSEEMFYSSYIYLVLKEAGGKPLMKGN